MAEERKVVYWYAYNFLNRDEGGMQILRFPKQFIEGTRRSQKPVDRVVTYVTNHIKTTCAIFGQSIVTESGGFESSPENAYVFHIHNDRFADFNSSVISSTTPSLQMLAFMLKCLSKKFGISHVRLYRPLVSIDDVRSAHLDEESPFKFMVRDANDFFMLDTRFVPNANWPDYKFVYYDLVLYSDPADVPRKFWRILIDNNYILPVNGLELQQYYSLKFKLDCLLEKWNVQQYKHPSVWFLRQRTAGTYSEESQQKMITLWGYYQRYFQAQLRDIVPVPQIVYDTLEPIFALYEDNTWHPALYRASHYRLATQLLDAISIDNANSHRIEFYHYYLGHFQTKYAFLHAYNQLWRLQHFALLINPYFDGAAFPLDDSLPPPPRPPRNNIQEDAPEGDPQPINHHPRPNIDFRSDSDESDLDINVQDDVDSEENNNADEYLTQV